MFGGHGTWHGDRGRESFYIKTLLASPVAKPPIAAGPSSALQKISPTTRLCRTMGSTMPGDDDPVEPDFITQVVIVGTGPAGGSLAGFLGSYGRFEIIRLAMCRRAMV